MLLSPPVDLSLSGLPSVKESLETLWPALLRMLQAEESTVSPLKEHPSFLPVLGELRCSLSCSVRMRWASPWPCSRASWPVITPSPASPSRLPPLPGPELAKAPYTSTSCCPLWFLELAVLTWLSVSPRLCSVVRDVLSAVRPPTRHKSDSVCSVELFSSLGEKETHKLSVLTQVMITILKC